MTKVAVSAQPFFSLRSIDQAADPPSQTVK